ncbi:hypothetical protein QMK33_16800 [Hymenobacter sp. H14-R3]|uniref:hypothetical protein n=1 Tax=Hymenobacter sp. H14-R3 TaxID=3046308 RepID=UPI0024B8E389|nr:hypothetical protein [Hymenobacter sp. H14-R3]MDJ0366815.1 hypothetical protein [Hymenobacter sp. H14-R3]
MISRQRYPFLLAASTGLLFALVSRFLFDDHLGARAGGLLTVSFLLLVPMALGAITAHFIPGGRTFWRLCGAPWLTVLLFILTTLLFNLEGLICLIIIGPVFFVLASMGAVVYVRIADLLPPRRDKTLVVAAFAVLPFVAITIENRFDNPDSFRRVENTVVINAPAAVVWQHIIRVAPIRAADLGHSLIDDIGFPRPIEATLTREGVGGVRHATFERGVEFIETVDEWHSLKRLSFSIIPNTTTIPPTTFDEHVIVGGRFFDVLRGTYELRPAGPGRTLLVLHSQQRLSTHLNWYAGLWTGFVMSEIQGRILGVLKRRCELK